MILPAEINLHEIIPPKKEGDTTLHKFVVMDKSQPAAARCVTPFELFGGDKMRANLPEGDLTDCPVFLLVKDMKTGRQGIQIHGEISHRKTSGASVTPAIEPTTQPAKK